LRWASQELPLRPGWQVRSVQNPAAFAAFFKAHQGALIGADKEGDAPADPALEHIVENLDLGHNGEGPAPEAAPRKGWPGSMPHQPNGYRVHVQASLRSPRASAAPWQGPARS